MGAPAFFERTAEGFIPRPHARSPWAPDMLHGRLLAALAAAELERQHLEEPLRLVRLSTDLFRVAPMEPVRLTVRPTRRGRRVRAFTVEIHCAGQVVAMVAALALAGPGAPPGHPWGLGDWSAPDPESLPAPPGLMESEPLGSPDLRLLRGRLGGEGPNHAWLREPWPLVEGEPLSAVPRAAMAADVANPLTNWSEAGLQYINADVNLHLVRPPVGEWIGLEVVDHQDHDGISVGDCRLHDLSGPIGRSVVTSLVRAFPPVSPGSGAPEAGVS